MLVRGSGHGGAGSGGGSFHAAYETSTTSPALSSDADDISVYETIKATAAAGAATSGVEEAVAPFGDPDSAANLGSTCPFFASSGIYNNPNFHCVTYVLKLNLYVLLRRR